jgi:hypothetical protein
MSTILESIDVVIIRLDRVHSHLILRLKQSHNVMITLSNTCAFLSY